MMHGRYEKSSLWLPAAMVLLLICGCALLCPTPPSMRLASGGQADACITLAADASAPEKTAVRRVSPTHWHLRSGLLW